MSDNDQRAALRAAPTNDDANRTLPTGQVLVGDALRRLRQLPSASIDTVVTSPPYWLLRNYRVPGQLGLEPTIEGWVTSLRAVLTEVARVLKPEGSLWINLGDTFARQRHHGAEPKSLVLGPERLVMALVREDGWRLRNKIVWAKPNPMPASVGDRLSTTWEPLYLLVRSRHYFFDLDTIRERPRSRLNGPSRVGPRSKYAVDGKPRPDWAGPIAGTNVGLERMKARGESSHALGKNPGDVWTVPTANYRGAHFATFPEALIERPLLAGCPERVCLDCGTAWRRASIGRTVGMTAVRGALRKCCACADPAWAPGVVLDPFFGAGTVGVVAERLHRRWVGIELSAEFARLARERIEGARRQRPGTAGTERAAAA